MAECLGMFAKYWEPGKVKTRLAAGLGAERAAEVYRHFLKALLERLTEIDTDRFLEYTPAERTDEFQSIASNSWQLEPQAEGNLGVRMETFFADKFRNGYERVVLVGSDSPQLPQEAIRQAFDLLKETQVVLGPTEDGGYWLVGASGCVPKIFHDIPWSTPQVWDATIAALNAAGHSHSTVEVCYDVDNGDDLQRLISDLQDSIGQDSHLDRLLERLC